MSPQLMVAVVSVTGSAPVPPGSVKVAMPVKAATADPSRPAGGRLAASRLVSCGSMMVMLRGALVSAPRASWTTVTVTPNVPSST